MNVNLLSKTSDKKGFGWGSMGVGPVLSGGNLHYEVSERVRAINWGGLGLVEQLVGRLGLAESIDEQVRVLQRHLPYRESDHVLSLVYNIMTGGRCLQDSDSKRCDQTYRRALGADRLPAPSTSGDYLRRFGEEEIEALERAFDESRLQVWSTQPRSSLRRGVIDVDGLVAPTQGECKEGMGLSYKGVWGYQPLVVTLANTGEVLRTVNRPGNRPSHDGAAPWIDQSVELVREGGFKEVVVRGDTAFSLTANFDRWTQDEVGFVFGMDAHPKVVGLAEAVPAQQWKGLDRPPRRRGERKPGQRFKERIVRERGYRNQTLVREDVTEIDYRPVKCRRSYRLVILRKTISMEKGQRRLFDQIRYLFYITNLSSRKTSAAEVVRESNRRCDQENVIEQLQNGVAAMRMPSDSLLSNWVWMVIASQAWNLKAWLGLILPESLGGRTLLRMKFRRFYRNLIQIPCQILQRGGRLIFRLLSRNQWTDLLLAGSSYLRRQPG